MRVAVDRWLTEARDALAHAAGLSTDDLILDEETQKALLKLARLAAHASGERVNAPLLTYLVGVAVGRSNGDPFELAAAVRSAG